MLIEISVKMYMDIFLSKGINKGKGLLKKSDVLDVFSFKVKDKSDVESGCDGILSM